MNKIGILGDIHANLAAFKAILEKLDQEGCERLVCTGDIVGYGPCPAECIEIVRQRNIASVLGNHDHYVTLLMDPRLERLRPEIRKSVEWTQGMLGMNDLKWLAQLPRKLDLDEFSVVHGSFGPKPWVYLTNEKSLEYNYTHQTVPLAFCGHSHIPLFSYYRDGMPPFVSYLRSALIPQDTKVMINVGSVGQPRDHDPRAAAAIYDVEEQSITSIRVAYDIAETQELMRQHQLPENFINRLELGR